MSHFKYFIAKINEIISNNRDNTQNPAIVRDAYRLKTALMLMGSNSFDQSMALAINEIIEKSPFYDIQELSKAINAEFLSLEYEWNLKHIYYYNYIINHSEHKIIREKIRIDSLSFGLFQSNMIPEDREETVFLSILNSYLMHIFREESI